MRSVTVSVLLICLIAATFSNWCIIAAYNINRQYISKQLCVNRQTPEMHCNGHCYLSKQLAKEDNSALPLNTKISEKFGIELFCIQFISLFSCPIDIAKNFCGHKQNFTTQQFIRSSFHPPQS